jgi:ribosomal subunit interface protein
MKIKIKATDITLTPAIKQYVEKKMKSVEKLLKSFEKEGEAYVYFEIARTTHHHKSGNVFYAEANVDLLGENVRAEQRAEDIRAAIDKVKDILKREIKELKEKQINNRESK